MKNVSGKRGSNPPPTAWKAVALPNELLPQRFKKEWERKDSNLRRLSQQIYSLSHLTALEPQKYAFFFSLPIDMDIFLNLFYNKLIISDIIFDINAFRSPENVLFWGDDASLSSCFWKKSGQKGEKTCRGTGVGRRHRGRHFLKRGCAVLYFLYFCRQF